MLARAMGSAARRRGHPRHRRGRRRGRPPAFTVVGLPRRQVMTAEALAPPHWGCPMSTNDGRGLSTVVSGLPDVKNQAGGSGTVASGAHTTLQNVRDRVPQIRGWHLGATARGTGPGAATLPC